MLSDDDKQAYILRQGWYTKGKPFEKMADEATKLSGRKITPEGIRKRFAKAKWALFKATGVYFKHSVKGLDDNVDGYGCPSYSVLDGLFKEQLGDELNDRVTDPSKPGKSSVHHDGDDDDSPLMCHGSVVTVILRSSDQTRTSSESSRKTSQMKPAFTTVRSCNALRRPSTAGAVQYILACVTRFQSGSTSCVRQWKADIYNATTAYPG